MTLFSIFKLLKVLKAIKFARLLTKFLRQTLAKLG